MAFGIMVLFRGPVIFLIILFIGFYLTELYLNKGEKDKYKKSLKELDEPFWNTVAIIGPLLLVMLIIGLLL